MELLSQAQLRLRRLLARISRSDADPRVRLARRYVRGEGLEIGALASPLPVGRAARVRYVDRLPVAQLRVHYPELAELELVEPDVLDDGETLASIPDESQDFIAASHFIEHCEDPIGALASHASKLRTGGVLFLVVPDKRSTFDAPRGATSIEHLVRDYEEGPEGSRRDHYESWVREVNGITDGADETVKRLLEERYSIHFHVWTPTTFLELLRYCSEELALPLELECFERAASEFFVVLSKRG